MDPPNRPVRVRLVSSGSRQWLVGPASSALREQMKVNSSTRATSAGSERTKMLFGRRFGSSHKAGRRGNQKRAAKPGPRPARTSAAKPRPKRSPATAAAAEPAPARAPVPNAIGCVHTHFDYTTHSIEDMKRFYTEVLGFADAT